MNEHMFFHVCVLGVCLFANGASVRAFSWNWTSLLVVALVADITRGGFYVWYAIYLPVCTISCFFKLARCVNPFIQMEQVNGFSSKWDTIKDLLRVRQCKRAKEITYLYGLFGA